jgi:hypothetical protein
MPAMVAATASHRFALRNLRTTPATTVAPLTVALSFVIIPRSIAPEFAGAYTLNFGCKDIKRS